MCQRQLVFDGRRIQVVVDQVTLPDGATARREIVLHPGAVTVVPMVDRGHVCLVRNYRHAVGQWLLELPAGTREPDEEPEQTAVRELAEETGYRCDRIRLLCEFFTSPGILNEQMLLYVAEGLSPGQPRLDSGEQVRPEVVAWDDAVRMALDGTIQDGKSLVGILFWQMMRGQVSGPGA